MRARAFWMLAVVVSCASAPPPDPLNLTPPAAPAAKAGEIRVYGQELPIERAEAIRERLRETEPKIVATYQQVLAENVSAAGRLQLRIAINGKGEVADLRRIQSEVDELLAQRVAEVLRAIAFGAGGEAYAFYTLGFQPDLFEVLGTEPEFAKDPPALAIHLLNRSTFRLSDLSVTVHVHDPEHAEPLRVSRRRVRAELLPGGRRTLHVPLASEFANERYSFLVDVQPAAP